MTNFSILKSYLPSTIPPSRSLLLLLKFMAPKMWLAVRFLYAKESSIYCSATVVDFHPPNLLTCSILAPVLANTVAKVLQNACPLNNRKLKLNF